MDLVALLIGAIGGLGYAIFGYLRKVQDDPTVKFDLEKAIKTAIQGFFVGFVAAYYAVPFDNATLVFISFGGTAIVEEIAQYLKKVFFSS
jgi:hypothetical protein